MTNSYAHLLPADAGDALLVGRVWRSAPADGPAVVAVRRGRLVDITAHAPTVSDLFERDDLLAIVRDAEGEDLGEAAQLVRTAAEGQPAAGGLRLLAPCDLQAIKACGVTFAVSLLERVIEEQAKGIPARAAELRQQLQATIGGNLADIKPGSDAALRLKGELVNRGLWSQYMEVGIGPDAEVFTKSQPMSAIGHGSEVGLHPSSHWNNPEPEIVLAVDSRGQVVGATLGNDVNLRDVEGRSALLLGKAKDNNGSCAIGPFIRLFDGGFTMDSLRQAEVSLLIEGADDGFVLEGRSRMREISRDPLDLVAQTRGAHHQYPDGFMLFLGTMFSPIKDRDAAGAGFTHHQGDRVSISTPLLGALVNTVQRCDEIEPWTFGVRALFANLAQRGLLRTEATRAA
ncbi:MAG: fumarylacetoacetate hydrolase family protein [Telluria sp.]